MILTKAAALNYANIIDGLNIGSVHGDVKTEPNWRVLYRAKNRPMNFKTGAGPSTPQSISTIPCHSCGIILPEDAIQVDHYMPQEGGINTDLHALKTLRALRLTDQVPNGLKGVALDIANLADFGLNFKLMPKGRGRGIVTQFATISAAAKWTTNEEGSAFLTLVDSVNGLEDLRRMCKNNLLNLAPLCGMCNVNKSNRTRAIA
ncbi:hypothetical protein [Fibrella forsythiae]|uniref:HNH nuclease domain-containing protein n=1 Tax=Fibrella forsythiae TaxID=2817061 RepID=A0ABS3JNJ8_9BACT|nr:hypothetical protein [Fibrella forsythiae]MBO0951576.1 hypothetical protein [Fibrella forsythiae]